MVKPTGRIGDFKTEEGGRIPMRMVELQGINGKVYEAFVPRSGAPEGMDCNCHGFSVAGGNVWLNDVSKVVEDFFEEVPEAAALRTGNLAVFDGGGHSALTAPALGGRPMVFSDRGYEDKEPVYRSLASEIRRYGSVKFYQLKENYR